MNHATTRPNMDDLDRAAWPAISHLGSHRSFRVLHHPKALVVVPAPSGQADRGARKEAGVDFFLHEAVGG